MFGVRLILAEHRTPALQHSDVHAEVLGDLPAARKPT
jgi:hypothetical protein